MTKLTNEQIARVAHEVNRQYVLGLRDRTPPPTRALGGLPAVPPLVEPEPPTYDQEPQTTRTSLLNGVEFVLANPNASPGEQHQNWMIAKQAQGWRYGPKKDPIRMEHPDLAPFDHLAIAEQAKDFIFRAVVKQLAALEIAEPVLLAVGAAKMTADAQRGDMETK